jgi:hypothetical protein
MYVVFWWHFHWFSQEQNVFEARLLVFCRTRNRFSCWDVFIRKMMNYLFLEKLKLIMRLILFELLFSTKKSSQFDVEISREWVWNQIKVDLTICMHLTRSRSVKKWIVIINIDYRSDEMSNMLVVKHFRSIHSCADCIQRSRSKIIVFHRKSLIWTLHFDISRLFRSSFHFINSMNNDHVLHDVVVHSCHTQNVFVVNIHFFVWFYSHQIHFVSVFLLDDSSFNSH